VASIFAPTPQNSRIIDSMSSRRVVDRRVLLVKDLIGSDYKHYRHIEATMAKWIAEQREQGREVTFRVDDFANAFIYEALDVVMDLQPTGVLRSGEAGPDDDARREAADDHRQVQDTRKGRAREDVMAYWMGFSILLIALIILTLWLFAVTVMVINPHPAT